jgi:hypothetical protein
VRRVQHSTDSRVGGESRNAVVTAIGGTMAGAGMIGAGTLFGGEAEKRGDLSAGSGDGCRLSMLHKPGSPNNIGAGLDVLASFSTTFLQIEHALLNVSGGEHLNDRESIGLPLQAESIAPAQFRRIGLREQLSDGLTTFEIDVQVHRGPLRFE